MFNRQHGQLRHLRQKYDEEKKKRVATQHVKWKFVKEKSNDRLQYGLPNDLEVVRCYKFTGNLQIFLG